MKRDTIHCNSLQDEIIKDLLAITKHHSPNTTLAIGSVPSKVFELEPILPNLTKMEGFLRQNY